MIEATRGLFIGGRESAIAQSASVVVGQPARGAAEYLSNRVARRFNLPHGRKTDIYFAPDRRERDVPPCEATDIPRIIESIGARLEGSKDTLGRTPRSLYSQWERAREALQEEIGSDKQLTNYVLYRPTGDHVLFFVHKGDQLSPLVMHQGELPLDAIHDQTQNYNAVSLPKHTDAALAIETGIKQIQTDLGKHADYDIAQERVDRLSRAANRVPLRRHAVFEKEGDIIRSLYAHGATSTGELQTVLVDLTETISYDARGGVQYDQDLANVWKKVHAEAKQESGMSDEQIATAFEQFANEVAFYQLVTQYFKERPEITEQFMASGLYTQFAPAFKDRFLASYGQTETAIAEAILANYFLSQFETTDVVHSPSQGYINDIPDFHSSIGEYVTKENNVDLPAILCESIDDQTATLQAVTQILREVTKPLYRITEDRKDEVIAQAEAALENVRHEKRRHQAGRVVMETLEARLPIIYDSEHPPTVLTEVVGNMIMTRVPGENRFTAASALQAEGYIPEGPVIPQPFESKEESPYQTIDDSLRYIFNGSKGEDVVLDTYGTGVESRFESQVGRMYEQAPVILDFLLNDDRVPENVRNLMQLTVSEDLPERLLEYFNDPIAQDPLMVNKFYPEKVSTFRTMLAHRFVTDFVRGVETELITRTGTKRERLKRKALPVWKDHDFSTVDQDVLDGAIESTLAFGSHRIDKLDNKAEPSTLKDAQESIEFAVFWDTFGMKFLRWQKQMNTESYLGYGWHCGCYYRKAIFNNTIPQY
jgi:hypothetical protein